MENDGQWTTDAERDEIDCQKNVNNEWMNVRSYAATMVQLMKILKEEEE